MSAAFLNLHKPNGEVTQVHTSHSPIDLLDKLPELFRQRSASLGAGFWVDLGISSNTHIFIARDNCPSTENDNCVMDVFAVEVDRESGGKMTEDEVVNSARSVFPDIFSADDSKGLTAYSFSGSASDQGE